MLLTGVGYPRAAQAAQAAQPQRTVARPPAAPAAAPAPAPAMAPAIPTEKVAVEQYQQQYWKTNNNREKSVVQYKLFPRDKRLQLGAQFTFGSSDPFLSIRGITGYLGYNFSEYIALNAIYVKWSVNNSSAYDLFVVAAGVGTNKNPLNSFMGGEVAWNVLYGKLSLLGAGIYHFDVILSGGAGIMSTENGSGMSALLGLGQQFYLNKTLSLKVDYRAFMFREKLIEKIGPPSTAIALGTEINTHWSWLHSVSAGFVVMF